MTYARSRLWLGVTGVGLSVVLALATIATGWPARLLPANPDTPFLVHVGHVAAVLGLQILLFFPLDVMGGCVVVRKKPAFGRFLGQWLRGAVVLYLVALVAASALLAVGRAAAPVAVVATAIGLGVLLLAGNGVLARVVAALPSAPATDVVRKAALRAGIDSTRVRLVTTDEEAFTGGWLGLTGGMLWLPQRWVDKLAPDELAAQLARRAAVRAWRWRGIALALTWNGFGLLMALQAPGGGAAAAAQLVTSSAWFTLWQFAGLLLLPSLSRSAIMEADAVAAVRVGADPTYRAIAQLDEWQESEPSRDEAVDTIFHPVPQLRERVERLQAGAKAEALPPGFYHATRTMLASGWAFSGLLGRVVHCNVGRPTLWVVFPSD